MDLVIVIVIVIFIYLFIYFYQNLNVYNSHEMPFYYFELYFCENVWLNGKITK
jgi:hypothetical protein